MLKQAAIDNVEYLAASENKNIYKKHAEGDIWKEVNGKIIFIGIPQVFYCNIKFYYGLYVIDTYLNPWGKKRIESSSGVTGRRFLI